MSVELEELVESVDEIARMRLRRQRQRRVIWALEKMVWPGPDRVVLILILLPSPFLMCLSQQFHPESPKWETWMPLIAGVCAGVVFIAQLGYSFIHQKLQSVIERHRAVQRLQGVRRVSTWSSGGANGKQNLS